MASRSRLTLPPLGDLSGSAVSLDGRGAGVPESRLVFDNDDVGSMYPLDWSLDGTQIAVQLTRADNTGQMDGG